MTKDYTKLGKAVAQNHGKKVVAAPLKVETHTAPENPFAKFICTQCYETGVPKIVQSGSWLGIILPWLFDEMQEIYGCKACGHPNSMVPITSRDGRDALHWHLKAKQSGQPE